MNKMISIILATSYILGNNLENSSTLLKFNTQNIQKTAINHWALPKMNIPNNFLSRDENLYGIWK